VFLYHDEGIRTCARSAGTDVPPERTFGEFFELNGTGCSAHVSGDREPLEAEEITQAFLNVGAVGASVGA
jgi:hypothetical protein